MSAHAECIQATLIVLAKDILWMNVFLSFMQIISKQIYIIWLGTEQMRHPFSNTSIHGDQNSHQPHQKLSNAKTEHFLINNSLLVTGERILEIVGLSL